MANMREMMSMGISLAVAVLATVMGAFVWISLPLLVLAVLLFVWALEPKRTEAFVGRLPWGNYLLKALAKSGFDAFRPELRSPHGSRRPSDGAPRALPPQSQESAARERTYI